MHSTYLGESLDKHGVVQDIACGVGQQVEDLRLDIVQLLIHRGVLCIESW
jgi:hypothetical protein